MVYRAPDGSSIVFSRFHWHVATVWTEPILNDSRPCCRFTRAIHTPLIHSPSYKWRYVEFERGIPQRERTQIVEFYLPMFDRIVSRKHDFGNQIGYGNLLSSDPVPEKYEFRLDDIRSGVIIGPMPKEENCPIPIRRKLWGTD